MSLSSTESLIDACKSGMFPSLAAMSDFGINNYAGINPVHIFECYRLAVNIDNVNKVAIHTALKKNKLNQVVLESPSVKKSRYYNEIIEKGGGIHNGFMSRMNECDICAKVSNFSSCCAPRFFFT